MYNFFDTDDEFVSVSDSEIGIGDATNNEPLNIESVWIRKM